MTAPDSDIIVIAIDTLPVIETRSLPSGFRPKRLENVDLEKYNIESPALENLCLASLHLPDCADRNAQWGHKEKILKALSASLPNCPENKCREVLKLMCSAIEEVFKSGQEGATTKGAELTAGYFLPGAIQVLRKQGYYEDLKLFTGPDTVKEDFSGATMKVDSKIHVAMRFLVHDMNETTMRRLTPLEMFQQLSGSIYDPNPNAPLKDITQSAAEAYVLVGKELGWQIAQDALLGEHASNRQR